MEEKFNSTVNKIDKITQCLPEKSTYFNENNDSLNLYDSFIEDEDYINNSINKIFYQNLLYVIMKKYIIMKKNLTKYILFNQID